MRHIILKICGLSTFIFLVTFFSSTSSTLTSQEECLKVSERVDCLPGKNGDEVSEDACVTRGCRWCGNSQVDGKIVPQCFLPKSYGYQVVGDPVKTSNGFRVTLKRATNITLFGKDVQQLAFEAEMQSDYRVRIKLFGETVERFEVPLTINPPQGGNSSSNPLYEILTETEPVFSFKIIRKSSGVTLFDSSLGGLTFDDQFLQIATRLPNKNLFGIGEHLQRTFRHSDFDNNQRWPMFARDQPISFDYNLYGVHPMYTILEDDGNAHAVAIINSNAQEFQMLPDPGLLYTTIGGILDIYMFLGPSPENVAQQYTEAVGRSQLPPYWSLGYQLCRYGYNSLENMQAAVERTAAASIPHDVQYGDIDVMDRQLDFTVSQDRFGGLPAYVKELKTKGIKFMTILDPCISIGEPTGTYRPFELGEEMDVWTKKADGTNVAGKVWPEDPVYFPDYSKNTTRNYWITLITEFKQLLDFDGLWIDMNEPASFVTGDIVEGCQDNALNNPPWLPYIGAGRPISDRTLCADHVTEAGVHYDTHSLFGWYSSEATSAGVLAARAGKRSFVLSRSTFLGSGKWTAHWLGDNYSEWPYLHMSIIGMLEFNMFGIPFVGSDICGFFGDSSPRMCQRWHQLGAFYPFSRNHNGLGYKRT